MEEHRRVGPSTFNRWVISLEKLIAYEADCEVMFKIQTLTRHDSDLPVRADLPTPPAW